jgi:hypothetical protein
VQDLFLWESVETCSLASDIRDVIPLTQVHFKSRNYLQYFGTGPIDQGGPDMVGLMLGSRELLCLWWSNMIFLHVSRGVFQRVSARHVDVTSTVDSTRHVVSTYRYRDSIRHVVDVLSGYNTFSVTIHRRVSTFADSIRCSHSVGEDFFPHR